MPTYEITAPDGKVLEITAPEGATQEEVLAYAQAQYRPAQSAPVAQPTPQQPEVFDPTDGMSGMDKFLAGMGRSVAETGRGLKQLGTEAANRSVRNSSLILDRLGAESASRALAERLGVPLAQSLASQQEQAAENRRLDAPLMNTGAGFAGNIVGAGLQAAIPVGGASGQLASATGRLAPYIGASARGAAYAGAQPVVEDESRLQNAAVGGAAGAAGQGVASLIGRSAASAKAALSGPVRESIEAARSAGIPLSVAQVANSRFVKSLGSVASSLPLTGGARAAARQQEGFNRAVGRTFGVKDAPVLSDDVMAQARQAIGAAYDDVFSRNNVALDQSAINKILSVERDALRDMTADQAQVVRNQVQRIVDEFANGPITGQKYQALRGALANLADNSTLGRSIKNLRSALDETAFRSVGKADADALRKANSMWANMRTTEKALKQVPGAAGNVRPASLYPLIRDGSTQEMRELAKVGQNVLKDPIPNSGTPERQFIYNLLGLGGAGFAASSDNPLLRIAGAGLLAGRAMNSPLAARALLASQPAAAAAQGTLARIAQATPYVLPGVAHAESQPLEINVIGGRPGDAPTEDELEELRRMGRIP